MRSLSTLFSNINLDGIENIIFDFGGVLFDIDYHAPVRAFAELGMKQFEEVYAQATQHDIFDKLETGQTGAEEFYQWLETQVPSATRAQIVEAWNCILLGLDKQNADFAGALSQQYPVYIFSNTNAIHAPVFEAMIDDSYGWEKFSSHFRSIIYSHQLGLRKPHPEAFLEVCKRHNLQPSATLFLDDSRQHVEGALKAGLKAEWVH
ncbi:MAG: HAD family phosphatase [Flavobacteriales bacterium]|nr:HAD family phosphatase [Flavobacteriales bacterium]